ncbi:TetR/AcrR family transcriptional regulator [Nonomuraea sp. NPDC049714]|uniref:TetR/AcrR family transcriptional regulator n=1 Tax=Nonomuraea sp. NPDC049714 TaxID=3364357 RepID=UPI0037A7DC6F
MSSVWSRPAPQRRPALTREAIVAAAVSIADAEGLGAVSIRRVAAELGARAMSLYTYIERKEDLLALMLDEVAGELLAAEPQPGERQSEEGQPGEGRADDGQPGEGQPGERPPGGWREALLLTAGRERDLVRRHPWRVELISQRVAVGPNGLRHVERKLSALDGLGVDRLGAWRILAAVDDYVTGFVVREAAERAAPRREGVNDAERAAMAEPYIRDLVASGEFPRLAPMLEQGVRGADDNFERGLRWVLDGIEGDLPGR